MNNTTRSRLCAHRLESRDLPAIFTVTNVNDAGSGSLRQAVLAANGSSGDDTIVFDSAVFATAMTITLTTGYIDISDSVRIQGPGPQLVTVSGNSASRIFVTSSAPSNSKIDIEGLSFSNGKTNDNGGAVLIDNEQVTFRQCSFHNNNAVARGGAVHTTNGIVAFQDCDIRNNTSGYAGGGVALFTSGRLSFLRCNVNDNVSSLLGGGGISVYDGGSVTIDSSTVSGNKSYGSPGGGGLCFSGAVGSDGLTIRNSTISGNLTAYDGGGVCLSFFTGTLSVLNSTIANNSAAGGFGGGGIARVSGGGTIVLTSAIVTSNEHTTGNYSDLFSGGSINATVSAVGTAKYVSGFNPDTATQALLGQNLKLGALANNGGPTLTHSLLPGSPCIDAGDNPNGLTTDQRGTGFARVVGSQADIGAVEVQVAPTTVKSTVMNDGAPQRSRVTALTVTFDQTVSLPVNPADAFQLQRQSDSATVTLDASVTGNAVTLSFVGGPVESKSLADGRYTLTILAAQVNAGNFDGNGDGVPGGNYVLAGDTTTNKLFRLYGDSDGDGDVDITDFAAFRGSFGTTDATFDSDGDGDVDLTDFGSFRLRFGSMVP